MSFNRRRKSKENELANLISEHPRMVGCTSGNNQGWDVIAFHDGEDGVLWQKSLQFEVKSSVKSTFRFDGRGLRQLRWYRRQWKEHHIRTWYAYRLVDGSKGTERSKWRFFRVTTIDKKLVWEEGLTWKLFWDLVAP